MAGRQDELAREQAVVDRLYGRLDELRDLARERLADVRRSGPTGSPQNRSERDAFATLYEDRAAQLDAVEDRLVFGRLDLDGGTTRYVGRVGLADDAHRSLLTDWRAPAATAFYRATALHPGDVRRRRHLVTTGRTVAGIEDEVLDLDALAVDGAVPDGDGQLSASSLSGEGALLASLATRRTGRMTDIVSTIQAEQDRIIRADLAGALVVQGGPGTGKTAVALHRAAYLLYAHRRLLERSGVLLVGPSRAFLRYIDQVLPSLGETGVVSTTVGELVPGVRATATDHGLVARLKGRLTWQAAIRRAVRARQRVPAADVAVRVDGHDVVVRRRDVRDAIARARRTHKPHNEARTTFVREMLSRLVDQRRDADGDLSPEEAAAFTAELRAHRDVRVALNLAWFPLTPERLVADLFAKPHRLAEAAPELTDDERAALRRDPDAAWTESDVPLLDEAAELLGEDDSLARAQDRAAEAERAAQVEYARSVLESSGAGGGLVDAETLASRFEATGPRLTTAERAASDRTWTYGHVVVDEAQELSPMAWRMLVRRVPTRSMTIVGDVAQTSSAAGARSWPAALDEVLRDSWRLAELTVSYRTPAAVADAAQRMAAAAGLPVSELTAAREVDGALELVPVGPGGDEGEDEVVGEAVDRALGLAGTFVERDGSGRVAVIAPAGLVGLLRERVADALPAALGGAEAARLLAQQPEDAQLTVLDPHAAKGLEYDAVVLVEPARVAEGDGGVSDLYVAMTRPTQRLVAVHSRPLPDGIEAPAGA